MLLLILALKVVVTTCLTGIAKNVILFLGDGMSIPTLAAARIYLAKLENDKLGEERELSFEKLPYTGLSKTYCANRQVADSACTATAYLCGVKANYQTIGVIAAVDAKDCQAMENVSNHVHSIARWSQLKGKRTGIVTTSKVTDASPAGVYAHTAYRGWQTDTDIIKDNEDPTVCRDIAYQLVHGLTGKKLNVIFGGGRDTFLPNARIGRRNLIREWFKEKSYMAGNSKYVGNREQLMQVSDDTEYVLGLFSKGHMAFNLDRNPYKEPSLTEMTEKAIRLLSRSSNGFFLFVEGAKIDKGHHASLSKKALDETIEFHKAIKKAISMTNSKDTLIVVTSDHSHTMSVSGYPDRGSNIFNIAGVGMDGLPYSTLNYATGPGYKQEAGNKRYDISKDNLEHKNYKYPALVPISAARHGGADVAIFAQGPWAHLLTGVVEQSVIAHVMAFASCVNNDINACNIWHRKRRTLESKKSNRTTC